MIQLIFWLKILQGIFALLSFYGLGKQARINYKKKKFEGVITQTGFFFAVLSAANLALIGILERILTMMVGYSGLAIVSGIILYQMRNYPHVSKEKDVVTSEKQ